MDHVSFPKNLNFLARTYLYFSLASMHHHILTYGSYLSRLQLQHPAEIRQGMTIKDVGVEVNL